VNERDSIFLKTARTLAQSAAQEVLKCLHQPISRQCKEDHSLVTDADLRSDQILRKGLLRAFPDHAVLTEESDFSGSVGSQFVWLIDPLDGTKAFARGTAGFCVMAGLLYRGQPYLGVVVDPLEGHLYEAVRGSGSFHEFQGKRSRVHVSSRNQFSEMPVVVSTGFPEKKLKILQQSLTGPMLPPINSVGIKVGLVVRRKADIYLSHHSVHYWDTCAPQIIIEEADGLLTRVDGTPLNYSLENSSYSHESLILGSNSTRHQEIVSLFSDVMKTF
jgi:3'(2'), 5'-bisphosphate nucleotidase